ncbi:hypothetical protein Tdes44962_MAKER02684 [Teratosphaeria destructans]|uniref:Uncharacterized protein n=1 Tax=Teratosphaeria destructans TaxID=418781 RepID=A0A9W7SSM8_9PEZI|nr:hypothetical protein Tdes44962_MAKER02684 [Teratosphaeria destructans]
MRFFATLTVAFAALSAALPAVPSKRTATPAVIAAIESELDKISVTLNDDITKLVDALGLSEVDCTVDELLEDLVGEVDSLDGDVDDAADGLLDKLGLSGAVMTIDELEATLGLSSTDTVGTLLVELGILRKE